MSHLKNKKFEAVPEFTWTEEEEKANTKFIKLRDEEAKDLPKHMFQSRLIQGNIIKNTLSHKKLMESTTVYKLLDTMPKGVLHHLHVDCNEDLAFLKKYVLDYPGIYISRDWKSWQYGTKEEAQKGDWMTVTEARSQFTTESDFDDKILSITQMTPSEVEQYSYSVDSWKVFEGKIAGFFPIFYQEDLFKLYMLHISEYFVRNGYSRIELRAPIFKLRCRDPNQSKGVDRVLRIYEEVDEEMRAKYPFFSLGVIVFGLKMFSPEQVQNYFREIYHINSRIVVGIDMVQEEDRFSEFTPYADSIAKIHEEFPDRKLTGVFHAGETRDKRVDSVWKVLDFGTHRIGHGLNLIQNAHLMEEVRSQKVCIEANPLSNQFLHYTYDLVMHPSICFYHFGIPISISSDDPARFGYNGTTPDFFVVAHAFHFDLKDMKLLALYSIIYSLTTNEQKASLLKCFEQQWLKFVSEV